MSTVTKRSSVDDAAVNGLRASFRGEVVGPADSGYEEHRRVWNGSIDRRPGLIARCAGVADVRAAVRFGREHGLLVAVRGGGHSFPGLSVCEDGLLIEQAVDRFAAMGLEWHAEQSRKLLAPT